MSRPTHDRTALHYGIENDDVQVLSSDVGDVTAGSDLHAALAFIHNQLLIRESGPTLIFADRFDRVVAQGPGGPWSLNPYDEAGDFFEDTKSYVNGSYLVVPVQGGNWFEAWTAFPYPRTGHAYFDFFVPSSWNTANGRPTYGLTFDSVNYYGAFAMSQFDGITWHLGQEGFDNESSFSPTPSTWYRLHANWNGTTLNMNAWKRSDPEPGGWQYSEPQLFATYDESDFETPFLDLFYFPRGSSDDGGIDNVEIWTSDTSWTGFGGITANAVLVSGTGATGSFTVDAVIVEMGEVFFDEFFTINTPFSFFLGD